MVNLGSGKWHPIINYIFKQRMRDIYIHDCNSKIENYTKQDHIYRYVVSV